jgi:hypothetical protein
MLTEIIIRYLMVVYEKNQYHTHTQKIYQNSPNKRTQAKVAGRNLVLDLHLGILPPHHYPVSWIITITAYKKELDHSRSINQSQWQLKLYPTGHFFFWDSAKN